MKKIISFAVLSFSLVALAPAYAETPPAKPDATTPAAASTTADPTKAAQAAKPADPAKPGDAAKPADATKAGDAAKPAEATPPEDPLKGITIHKHPDDFATAQQLAVDSRNERIADLQNAITCIQAATTMDEIVACQVDERKTMDKIRLSYCDTSISPLGKNTNRVKKGKGKGKGKGRNADVSDDGTAADGAADASARYKPTECDKALSAVTGKPIQPRSVDDLTAAPQPVQ